eukprot:s631_g16.t3
MILEEVKTQFESGTTVIFNRLFDFAAEALDLRFPYFSEDQVGDMARTFRTLQYHCPLFLAVLRRELPYRLHEYAWWNLIDIGEMYVVLQVQEKEIAERIANEVYKLILNMKYSYPAKALKILAFLEVGDKRTLRLLVRNVPRSISYLSPQVQRSNQMEPAMEVCFLASGERVALLDAADFQGRPAKAVKQALVAEIGATTFRQRLFLEGGTDEIPDDEVFASVPQKLQLVVSEFCPPDAREDQQMISAARDNDTAVLEQLLKRPRNPNTRDGIDMTDMTPLHAAAEHGHVAPMRLLLEAGAEIDAPSVGGKEAAPLHAAAQSGHLEAVRFLIQNGAQKDLWDAGASPPLLLAVAFGHVDTARVLVQEGASTNELGYALIRTAEYGDLDMVRFLLEIGCDKDTADMHGATPMHTAAENGHLDIVRFLVESGASRHSTDEDGRTPLDLASESGQAEVVRFLSEF